MCYNSEVSIKTFILGVLLCLFLWYRNFPTDRLFALIWISVVSMQLIEYFLWIDQNCGLLNRYSTIMTLIILFIQPIFVLIGLKYLEKTSISTNILSFVLSITIILFLTIVIIITVKKKDYIICSKPGKNQHLIWDYDRVLNSVPKTLTYIYYAIYWITPLLILFIDYKLIASIYLSIFYLSSIFTYYLKKDKQWKSYWCYIINYLWVLPVVLGYLYFGFTNRTNS